MTNKSIFSRSVLAVVMSSIMVAGSALANESLAGKAEATAEQTADKAEQAVKQAGGFMNDSMITGKVKSALLNDDAVASVDISVETTQGRVVLSGFVPAQAQAERAVGIAEGVKGVVSVDDQLHVREAGTPEDDSLAGLAGDALITGKIKAVLLADPVVAGTAVSVETDNGVVHLSGEVDSPEQAAQAANLARNIDGVDTVKNDIKVVH
ncbi:molecular chaperone OsmY [Oceanimonas sp. GK1]|uniref:molecular chaperone OsmY n=1 Tax=Oceanimonas sp. (strain GK1 / IBRC-M 10197) TaxID=511062 RepID=UPI0005A137BA|nr:molecular chaperone OsmY [Oceanimonas sp. GK1]